MKGDFSVGSWNYTYTHPSLPSAARDVVAAIVW